MTRWRARSCHALRSTHPPGPVRAPARIPCGRRPPARRATRALPLRPAGRGRSVLRRRLHGAAAAGRARRPHAHPAPPAPPSTPAGGWRCAGVPHCHAAGRAGPGRLRDRDDRVRGHGVAARGLARRGDLDSHRRAPDQRLRARRGRRRSGDRGLRRQAPAPRSAGRADGDVRRLQRAELCGVQLRDAHGRPVPGRSPARCVLRRRRARGGQPRRS